MQTLAPVVPATAISPRRHVLPKGHPWDLRPPGCKANTTMAPMTGSTVGGRCVQGHGPIETHTSPLIISAILMLKNGSS